MNVISVLAGLPPSSIKLFDVMVKEREVGTNEVNLEDLRSRTTARYLQNHLPALIKVDLVRRIKRGHYIINPDAVMPPNTRAARIIWNAAKQG